MRLLVPDDSKVEDDSRRFLLEAAREGDTNAQITPWIEYRVCVYSPAERADVEACRVAFPA